jgi:hypothetical protein
VSLAADCARGAEEAEAKRDGSTELKDFYGDTRRSYVGGRVSSRPRIKPIIYLIARGDSVILRQRSRTGVWGLSSMMMVLVKSLHTTLILTMMADRVLCS